MRWVYWLTYPIDDNAVERWMADEVRWQTMLVVVTVLTVVANDTWDGLQKPYLSRRQQPQVMLPQLRALGWKAVQFSGTYIKATIRSWNTLTYRQKRYRRGYATFIPKWRPKEMMDPELHYWLP